jgi:hemoglobin-like flavoprotein
MVEATDVVKSSFGRAMTKPNFMARFYEIFIQSNPQIPQLFKNTDMKQQHELLSQSLSMVVLFAQGNPVAKGVINRIRSSHDRAHMNINPALYSFWEDSLIAALAECDPQFDPVVEQKWREVLRVAIDHIKAGY